MNLASLFRLSLKTLKNRDFVSGTLTPSFLRDLPSSSTPLDWVQRSSVALTIISDSESFFYSLSCRMYILLHFLILVTIHMLIHYSCTRIFCISYILLHIYSVDIITVSSQRRSMIILHTTYLHVHIHNITTMLMLLLD